MTQLWRVHWVTETVQIPASEGTYNATISEPNQPDAMPMWESFDHATAEDAYRAAQAHIHATQPGDRVVDEGNGVYTVWAAEGSAQPTHVATVVVAPTDDLHAAPARKSEQARG